MDLRVRFDALVEELSELPGVEAPGGGRGFGASALKSGGSIFAMVTRGHLVVKLPRERVAELTATGRGGSFDAGKGRPMKEWLTVLDDESWSGLAREAFEFLSEKGR